MNELNIDTVLFDWGGVFQRTLDYTPRLELASEFGIEEAMLEKRVFEHPALVQASQGTMGAEAAWQAVVDDLGFRGTMPQFINRFFAGDRVDQQLVSLVRWLRAHGTRVGLLSNAPGSVSNTTGIAGRWGIEGLFDAQVFSYQLGVSKPHPRAFEAALNALEVSAARVVFVDDFIENVQGAETVGLNALLFRDTPALLADLRRLGICTPKIREL